MRKYIFATFSVAVIIAATLTVSVSTFANSGTGGTGGSTPGLIGHWTFDDGTATDSSGNGNDGVVNGAALALGRVGPGSLNFDGVDDHVDLGPLDVVGDSLTVAAWVNSDNLFNCAAGDCRIFSKATGVATDDHLIMVSTITTSGGPKLRFRLKTGTETTTLIASTGVLSDGTWHHVAATYDGAFMRLFLDGVEVGSTAKTGTIAVDPLIDAWIGGNPPSATVRPWDGKLDDVRLYETALSLSDIDALANPLDDANAFIYWVDGGSNKIQRMRLSDSTVEDLVATGSTLPNGLDVAPGTGKFFWANEAGDVNSANLDGSAVGVLAGPGGRMLEVDESAGRAFWISGDSIRGVGLNGLGDTVFNVVGVAGGSLVGIGLDRVNQHIYWSAKNVGIGRANYAGDGGVTLISDPALGPYDIAIDPAGGKIYIAGEDIGEILRSNLDGTGLETLVSGPDAGQPLGIDLDLTDGKVYWSDRTGGAAALKRSNLDGTGVETILTGLSDPRGVALGPGSAVPAPTPTPVPPTPTPAPTATPTPGPGVPAEYIYWVDTVTDKVQRLTISDSTIDDIVTTGLDTSFGVAVSESRSKLFWTDDGDGQLRSANLDGTGVTQIGNNSPGPIRLIEVDDAAGLLFYALSTSVVRVDLDTLDDLGLNFAGAPATGIGLDPVNQQVYWSSSGGGIGKMNYDGSGAVMVIDDPTWTGFDIAIDADAGHIYIADEFGRIRRSNLDGTGLVDLITGADPGTALGIDLDLAIGKIYWSDNRGRLMRANLDGSNVEELIDGLTDPIGIALGSGVPVPPPVVHTVTETGNITVLFGGSDDTITALAGSSARIELTGLLDSFPISGPLAFVQQEAVISTDGGATNLNGTDLEITDFIPGDALNDPWIQVLVLNTGPYTINHISYPVSGSSLPPGLVIDDVADTVDLSGVFGTSTVAVSDSSKTISDLASDVKVFLDAGGGTKGTQIAGPGGTGEAVVVKVNNFGTHLLIESHVNTGPAATDIIVEYQTSP